VIVAIVWELTPLVAIGNVAEKAPEPTLTDGGTLALELFDARLMTAPPFGAAFDKFTVPVEGLPP
jgi:hypothetical protein